MRLLMMGTGPFAVPTFRGLFDTHHAVVALVTGPVRTHRGRSMAPVSAMRDIAHQHNTPIFDPENVNSPEARAQLTRSQIDLLVVCDYGQILTGGTLSTSRLGGVNLHGSLLPRYRGAAPINWSIYNGDTDTGVTVIHMTPKVDAGPCIAQAHTPIDPEETAVELRERLAQMGVWLIRRAIESVEVGRLEALAQDPALASKAPRLKKTDGVINWTRPAAAIRNQVRALQPWPKTHTFWHRTDGPPVRLIVGPVPAVEATDCDAPPGTVLEASAGRLVVATGESALRLGSVQPAGKRVLSIEQFLRGYRVKVGDCLGGESG